MPLLRRCLFLTVFLAAHTAYAAPYFNAATIAPTLIDPPPAVQSPEWQHDVEHIIELQRAPNAKDLEQAKAERNMKPEMVAEDTDAALTRASRPKLYALLDRVSDTSYQVNNQAKNFWNTKRPYLMDQRIKPLIEPHDNPAYPSGHTSGSYVWAYVLAMVIPAERDRFLGRAESIAQHRVLVGMHYPHDLKGGRALALLIVGALTQNAEFRSDLQAAIEEAKAK